MSCNPALKWADVNAKWEDVNLAWEESYDSHLTWSQIFTTWENTQFIWGDCPVPVIPPIPPSPITPAAPFIIGGGAGGGKKKKKRVKMMVMVNDEPFEVFFAEKESPVRVETTDYNIMIKKSKKVNIDIKFEKM